MKRLRVLSTLLLVLVLVGCAIAAPSTTVPAAPADQTASTGSDANRSQHGGNLGPGQVGWPREVQDAFGEVVVIGSKPQRILTLSLGLDEVVMALTGPDRFVAISDIARSDYSNIAEKANRVPAKATSDLEHIVSLEPDLLLLDGFAQPELVQQARAMGLTILVTDLHEDLPAHLRNIEFLAYVLGEDEAGAALVAEIEARADALAALVMEAQSAPHQTPPRVLHLTPSLHVPGAGTTSDDIITRAGGVNVAASAGINSWQQIALEKVAELAPDVIIHDEYDAEKLRSEVLAHPSLEDVPAIRHDRVYVIPARYLTTLSFWNLRGAEELARALWPDTIGSVEFADFE